MARDDPALAALMFGASAAVAGEAAAFCAAAQKEVDADPRLAAEVAAAFGEAAFTAAGEDCLYPLKVLRYAGADVLVVQAGEPGEGCHGCEAALSAYVVVRVDGGLGTVARFRGFFSLGTNGAVGDISPVQIGGDDSMAIESGGTFQGYTSTAVDFYAFHAGELVSLNPITIIIAADNSDAETDPSKAIEVTATWFFDNADKTASWSTTKFGLTAHRARRVAAAGNVARPFALPHSAGSFSGLRRMTSGLRPEDRSR